MEILIALVFSANEAALKNIIDYRKVSNIRRTKCQNLIDSRLVFKFSVPNPLKC